MQKMSESKEAAVELSVFGQKMSSPIDTAAGFIWADESWFMKIGGHISPTRADACAADG